MNKRKKILRLSFLSAILLFVLVFSFVYVSGNFSKTSECANSISCVKDLSGKSSDTREGTYLGKEVTSPPVVYDLFYGKKLLGTSTAQNKHIYVDLTHQKLYAYEGNDLVYTFLISSGKWHYTPTGNFRIWIKLRYTRMTGGDPAIGTYYDLPNVPYTMFFYNDEYPKHMGYGLHGTYWHHNFGHPMSHGCVNMKTEDAEKIYYWSNPQVLGLTTFASDDNPGTPITIYGVTPVENN